MLPEILDCHVKWADVMPGVRAASFRRPDGPFPLPVQPKLAPLHFEVLFCQEGSVTLTRRDGTSLTAGRQEVLVVTDSSSVSAAQVDAPLAGVLVAVDARRARESLEQLCGLLGGLSLEPAQVRRRIEEQQGCVSIGQSDWSRAVFTQLELLPAAEQCRYCVLKSVELLYLLCMRRTRAAAVSPALSGTLAKASTYMECHLSEPLTIADLSRRFFLSATAFKAGFRQLHGKPVHAWLRERRIERAAELLHTPGINLLTVAQTVGYSSASQFSAAFRKRYGMTPRAYQKCLNEKKV